MTREQYKPAQHPATGAWYVMGNCGGGHFMQMFGPYSTCAECDERCALQRRIDASALRDLLHWDGNRSNE